MYGLNCKNAQPNGAKVLHGCRRVFHNDKEPSFKAIYSMFESVRVLNRIFNKRNESF